MGLFCYYRSIAVRFKGGTVDLVSIWNVTTRLNSSLRKREEKEEKEVREGREPHSPS